MSTEMMVPKAETFLSLSTQAGGLAEAQAASGESVGLGGLTWVRTPSGGSTTWEIEDGLGNSEPAKEIIGIICLYRKRAILWGTEGEPQEGARPLLVSDDHPTLTRARRVGDDFGDLDPEIIESARMEDGSYHIDPQTFYYRQFGTSSKGPGPRMKEQRIIGVLRQGDMWPLMLTIQPGSLKAVANTIARLTVPYWRAVARFSLAKDVSANGQPYSKVQVQILREVLSEEQGEAIRRNYTGPLTNAILGGAVQGME